MRPKTLDMEVAVSNYFSPRRNLIVPNVYWGLFGHEVDMCVLSPAGYASEIEIKVDRSDLIKDKEKRHGHNDPMIKYLYFAIPEHLEKDIEHIPERAGVLIVKWNEPFKMYGYKNPMQAGWWSCRKKRDAKIQYNRKWADYERSNLLRLGAMRIWGLKTKLQKALEG